jgi:hypothetical protein
VDEDLKAIAGANGPQDSAFIVRLRGGVEFICESACVGRLKAGWLRVL